MERTHVELASRSAGSQDLDRIFSLLFLSLLTFLYFFVCRYSRQRTGSSAHHPSLANPAFPTPYNKSQGRTLIGLPWVTGHRWTNCYDQGQDTCIGWEWACLFGRSEGLNQLSKGSGRVWVLSFLPLLQCITGFEFLSWWLLRAGTEVSESFPGFLLHPQLFSPPCMAAPPPAVDCSCSPCGARLLERQTTRGVG